MAPELHRTRIAQVLLYFPEPGESIEDCLHREVREEIGVAIEDALVIGTTHFYRGAPRPENELLGLVFLCTIADPDAICIEAEHAEARWLTAAQAMALLDAVARLQPGVLSDADSHAMDSFNPALDGLLDCPHYTRPEEWAGQRVPEVLLSGNHAHIERWRRDQRLKLTAQYRPDLLEKARTAGLLTEQDEAVLAQNI